MSLGKQWNCIENYILPKCFYERGANVKRKCSRADFLEPQGCDLAIPQLLR